MLGIASRLFPEFFAKRASKPPNNACPRSTADIDADVARAINLARHNIAMVKEYCPEKLDPRVLEIGPGYEFGAQILLASSGARVTTADRFLTQWNDAYHPAFYQTLLTAWGKQCVPLEAVIETSDPRVAIELIAEPAEDLRSLPDAHFDVVLSNAVLEHISDPPMVARELARITRQGGVNSHQIDFRDHRDSSKPLEFLLMDDSAFVELFDRTHGETGNRWRHVELANLFRINGFQIDDATPNERANAQYLANFLPRLRRSTGRFAEMSDLELAILGARFVMHRE
jgi:SAM-dependent methyltransferase